MKQIAPPHAATRFWLHIGANVAARDWHDIAGHLTPLHSVDSQRFLSISPALLPLARAIFVDQAGYEATISSDVLSAGEQIGRANVVTPVNNAHLVCSLLPE